VTCRECLRSRAGPSAPAESTKSSKQKIKRNRFCGVFDEMVNDDESSLTIKAKDMSSEVAGGCGSCQVRVGVRVRPLTSRELAMDGKSVVTVRRHSGSGGSSEIQLGTDEQRRFTYDLVFDESTCQSTLYETVAPSLLQSVLDGYNATVC
jgi:hypothetical protein